MVRTEVKCPHMISLIERNVSRYVKAHILATLRKAQECENMRKFSLADAVVYSDLSCSCMRRSLQYLRLLLIVLWHRIPNWLTVPSILIRFTVKFPYCDHIRIRIPEVVPRQG